MLRVASTDELAADALWALGAIAVAEHADRIEAGFGSAEDERAAAASVGGQWPVDIVDDDGRWADAWRAAAVPVTVGPITIRPAWTGGDGIAIEPGRVFGVGSHPTTRLAIEALIDIVRAGDRVLDVGTGTGVLALVAVELGAATVVAIDNDAHAVDVARANVAANDCSRITVTSTPIADLDASFDVVVANLGGLLTPIALAADLARCTTGSLIIGGLLDPNDGGPSPEPLDAALARLGFGRGRTWSANGWCARAYQPGRNSSASRSRIA